MALPVADDTHAQRMDEIYRWQRLIYDVTRKYYLLGRDQLLREMMPPLGGSVLEVGCGTARNLIAVAQLYSDVECRGLDISAAMLETAGTSVERAGLSERIHLRQADACAFNAGELFGKNVFDRVFLSYALSMIPNWQDALVQAANAVAPGGQLMIVDFGGQTRLPALFKRGLRAWLAQFDVTPRDDLSATLDTIATDRGWTLRTQRMYRDYAMLAVLRRPA